MKYSFSFNKKEKIYQILSLIIFSIHNAFMVNLFLGYNNQYVFVVVGFFIVLQLILMCSFLDKIHKYSNFKMDTTKKIIFFDERVFKYKKITLRRKRFDVVLDSGKKLYSTYKNKDNIDINEIKKIFSEFNT